MATYATAAELKAEADVPDSVSNDEAERLIEEAEDAIDLILGTWTVQEDTGRKIVEDDVLGWQWSRLKRATVRLAAQLYAKPGLLTETSYESISGPDFSMSGRKGGDNWRTRFGPTVVAAILGSQLLRQTARLRP